MSDERCTLSAACSFPPGALMPPPPLSGARQAPMAASLDILMPPPPSSQVRAKRRWRPLWSP